MTGGGGWPADDGSGDGDEWADDTLGAEWRAGDPPPAGARVELEGAGPDHLDGGADDAVDPEHAAAVRTVRLLAAAAVLVVLAVVATLLDGTFDDADDGGPADDPTLAEAGATPAIGPAPGTAVPAYVEGRRAAVATVEGTRVAVVSLTSYRPETGVDALVEGEPGLEVLARLVALRGGEPAVVEGAVSSWVVGSRSAIQAERDEIAALLPTIEDPADPFIAGYTEDLARLDAQLAALDPAGDHVFGLVVRGGAEALRRLADRPEVRLLDVGASDEVGPLAGYRGLRPEEVDAAGTPPTRPA